MNGLLLLAALTFTITADSHLDETTSRELYERTLRRAAADKPAFHMDLGDTFMSEKQECSRVFEGATLDS